MRGVSDTPRDLAGQPDAAGAGGEEGSIGGASEAADETGFRRCSRMPRHRFASLLGLLTSFAPLFTAPSFRTFTMLACGFLAQTGRRTVCAVTGRSWRSSSTWGGPGSWRGHAARIPPPWLPSLLTRTGGGMRS
jgi:hypothetical protein